VSWFKASTPKHTTDVDLIVLDDLRGPQPTCPGCRGLVAVRNPTGTCDHLYWPDNLPPATRALYERFGHHHRLGLQGQQIRFLGDLIVPRSRAPELDACKVLKARGLTGKAVTYRGDMPCLVIHDLVAYASQNDKTDDKETDDDD
jgi:hypothetical protein